MYSTENTLTATKEAISQLIAKGYMDAESAGLLTALDDQYIVDLGKVINPDGNGEFNEGSPADVVFKSFLTTFSRIITDTRAYRARLQSLFVDPTQWGLLRENIMLDLSDCMIDEMWNYSGYIPWNTPESGGIMPGHAEGARIASIEFGFYRPPCTVKLYEKAHAVMVALTTARDQFFSAFRGVDELNQFLAGLYNSVENTLQVKAEIYAMMTVSMGAATAYANNNLYDLRAMFAASGGAVSHDVGGVDTPYTAAELLEIPEFQAFMLKQIDLAKEYMAGYSAIYNDHTIGTFSDRTQVIMLSQAASAAKFGVRANTYNEKLLGIGDYDRIPAWQAPIATGDSTPYPFETASKISLTAAAATAAGITVPEGDESFNISGLVCVIYDRMAMGITVDKRKPTSQYAASRDTLNTFYHSLISYIVNSAYPICGFYISEDSGE